jgi:cysteinyl-tRNA synthetase
MKIFNTLSRQLEEFRPIKKNKVGLYTCGPTVYNYAHIGNLRTYIFEDILKRVLEYNKYKVKHIMNITDVGHLTDDADAGEDKMEKGAAREGKSAWDIAKFYTKAFKKDLADLNILEPTKFTNATDNIKEQIALVRKLEKKGFTYQTSDGIYFDTSKLPDYGKLAQLSKQELRAGARVNMGEKKNPTDFALWKFSPAGEKRQMEWKSPWGIGFPGWHIECSAMAEKYLGQPFDIHCGGIDHVPVHHTNEIAQSEAANDKPLAHYWMHGEFLTFSFSRIGIIELRGNKKEELRKITIKIENTKNQLEQGTIILRDNITKIEYLRANYINKSMLEYSLNNYINLNDNETKGIEVLINKPHANPENYKIKITDKYTKNIDNLSFDEEKIDIKMSKSSGDFLTLEVLKNQHFNPLAYRYLLLQTHYRKQLNFSEEALKAAQNGLEHLYTAARELPKKIDTTEIEKEFLSYINNDLDIASALALVWTAIKQKSIDLPTLLKFDTVLGLEIKKHLKVKITPLSEEVSKLTAARDQARQNKNWSESDSLRTQIEALGYIVEDTPQGTKVIKK